jgi:pimeloyl-ACP methyl ester carboxylesterase
MRAYGETTLAPEIRSRFVANVNGLTLHVLEAGFETPGRPTLLLLHGFPELAYSWRKVMVPLARAGYRVIAPDQRGYGRTTGWDGRFDGDLASYRMLNLARDATGLVAALGLKDVHAVIGHDFGASVAGWCAMLRPDIFRRLALVSAPFTGAPPLPFATDGREVTDAERLPAVVRIDAALAALSPPRKHYHVYYSTAEADPNMSRPPQGVHAFLRAYYHQKSADWPGNEISPLKGWTAEELAKIPRYYVMDRDRGMADQVAQTMPSPEEIARCRWLTEPELAVYAAEFSRNGFQGGLNWYRCRNAPELNRIHELFAGATVDVPACFIAGRHDWGIHQFPGALDRVKGELCRDFRGVHLVDGAGHWVQQEQPEATVALLLQFLER